MNLYVLYEDFKEEILGQRQCGDYNGQDGNPVLLSYLLDIFDQFVVRIWFPAIRLLQIVCVQYCDVNQIRIYLRFEG